MGRFRIRLGLRFLGFAILFVGLAGLAVMTLWNALLPTILGVSVINFWQAIGLLTLSRILFGGHRGFGYGRGGWRRGGYGPNRAGWKQKMTERWQNMTPEQREQMKQQWRNKCGDGGRRRWGRDPKPDQPTTGDPAEPGGTTS